MFLSDISLKKLLQEGHLNITPSIKESDIRPNAIRVHLADTLIEYDDQVVDPRQQDPIRHKQISLQESDHILAPKQFVLGSTVESIQTPRDVVGFLDGRSTLARLGLMIHMTAAITDGLYEEGRSITLEIYNASNMGIVLSKGLAIGSLSFLKVDQPINQSPQTQYKGQLGATLPNLTSQYE